MTINYSKQVLLKRGNSAVSSTYVGPLGEVTVDTDFATIRVHDGVTPGGHLSTSSASGATPPPNPRESSIWYDTVGGRLYVYYDGAWVDASPSGDLFLAANVANLSVLVTGLTSDVANVETHIDSLDANIGAFETAFSANIGAFETAVNVTVGTLNANINTLNQTIAAFESNVGPTSDAWVDDAPPDISNVGALWYDDISGRLYVYYDGAWVDANPPITTGFGNVLPSANVTYSLGSEQYQWKDLWVSNNTIYIGNTPITVSNGSLLVGGNVVSGGGNTFNQNLNTTDAATFANVSATIGFISQINGTNPGGELVIQTDGTHNWIFDANGTTTFPGGGHISATKGGTALDAGYGYNTSLTTFYANANYAACVTGDAQTGTLNITAYNDGGPNPSRVWSFDKTGNLTLPAGGDILDSNGESVLGGGGAANTGNIVFSGSSIGLDEGSAEAADTYINISPNGEGWAYLQLPNDTSANVTDTRLWNAAGNVEIGTGDFSNFGASYTWNFNKDGSLTFPGGNITIASNIIGSGLDAMLGSANAAVGIIAQGESGSIGLQWSENGLSDIFGSNIAGVVVNSPAGSTPGTVQILTGAIGGSQYTWEFGADSVTTFPNGLNFGFMGEVYMTGGTAVFGSSEYDTNIVANASGIAQEFNFGTDGTLTLPGKLWAKASDSGSIAFTNNGVDEHGYLKVDAGYNMIVNAESNFSVKRAGTDRIAITDTTSDVKAVTDVRFVSNLAGSNKTWTFAASGIATLPSNSYVETTDINLKIGSQGNVTIRANAATGEGTQAWTFGTNGATTFPGNISVPGNLSNIAGFEFYNGDQSRLLTLHQSTQ